MAILYTYVNVYDCSCCRVLYVVLAVLICSLIAGLLLFFLISRSITLDSNDEIISPTILKKIKGEDEIFMMYQVCQMLTDPIGKNIQSNLYQGYNKTCLTH